VKKRAFSLIEILIAMLLLGLGLGVFSLATPTLFSSHTFSQEIKQLKERVNASRNLAENFQIPIEMEVFLEEGTLFYITRPLVSCSEKWERHFNKKGKIEGVKNLLCDGRTKRKAVITFGTMVGDYPASSLQIEGKRKQETLFINGYHEEESNARLFPKEVL
jgi:prepilin-type N-terminal cleavage/methylation domain-containing protein